MSKTKDLTVRERLIRAGVLLPAPRVPEPRAEGQAQGRGAPARVVGAAGESGKPRTSM